jgi:hypothetical protein
MTFKFKIKRKVALLSSCALALQSLMAMMPAPAKAGSDDEMAAFFYWKLPLGATAAETEPTYGFRLAETYDGWLLPPSGGPGAYSDEIVMPPLVDLSFGGSSDNVMPSLSFSGVDVGTVITGGRLNQGEDEGIGITPLGWVTLGVMAAGGAVAGCVAAGCFDDDDDDVAAEGGGGGEVPVL